VFSTKTCKGQTRTPCRTSGELADTVVDSCPFSNQHDALLNADIDRPMLAIATIAFFIAADSMLEDGVLESWLPGYLIPMGTLVIVYRWRALMVLVPAYLMVWKLRAGRAT
jgi:hypothetical protein